MRFEILQRDGLARIGRLDIGGSEVKTPALVFARTSNNAPPRGELALAALEDGKEGDLLVCRSAFFGGYCGDRDGCLEPGFRGSPYSEAADSGWAAVPVGMASMLLDSRRFVEAVDALKRGNLFTRPALCPVAGLPHRLAFLVYCGFDLLDTVGLVMATENGAYLTNSGALARDDLGELPCSCEACARGLGGQNDLLQHNHAAASNELRLVKHAISKGRLRELVEARIRADPWLVQNLRLLDLRHYELQEMHSPVKGSAFHAGSKESLSRPDVVRWRKRLADRYGRPGSASVLVLLPCSAKKPYSLSQSHRRFRSAIQASGCSSMVHEVVVTSPLGIVPRELELFYPAQDYDIPVTGHWDKDEAHMVRETLDWLVSSQSYDLVISHLGDERDIVNPVLSDFIDTSGGNPGSRTSLSKLEDVLREDSPGADDAGRAQRGLQDLASIARFQFGPAGANLCENARIVGRWPNQRMMKGEVQLGMLTGERGMISLTLDGGTVLAKNDVYRVEIEDFKPKGNLFAVGVERASPEVRIGDDVAVVHGDDVRAVGVARMCASEMGLAQRGEAVRIRHWAQ